MTYTSTKRVLATVVATVAMTLPSVAGAYMSPEEVLLNQYLPPTAREADERVASQTLESRQRREAAYQAELERQHAAAPDEEVTEEDAEAAEGDAEAVDDSALTAEDRELLTTLRLLTRIRDRQDILKYDGSDDLYGAADGKGKGKPPLTPTGAGTWLAGMALLGAGLWTLRNVTKAQGMVRIVKN